MVESSTVVALVGKIMNPMAGLQYLLNSSSWEDNESIGCLLYVVDSSSCKDDESYGMVTEHCERQ